MVGRPWDCREKDTTEELRVQSLFQRYKAFFRAWCSDRNKNQNKENGQVKKTSSESKCGGPCHLKLCNSQASWTPLSCATLGNLPRLSEP